MRTDRACNPNRNIQNGNRTPDITYSRASISMVSIRMVCCSRWVACRNRCPNKKTNERIRNTSSDAQQNHCRHLCLGRRNVDIGFTRKDQVPEITGAAQHTDGGSLTCHFSQRIKVALGRLQRIRAKSTFWNDGLVTVRWQLVGDWVGAG